MDARLEYVNEASINENLKCSICHSPFIDPRSAPCGDTFCRQCIADWIQNKKTSCPLCRGPLSVNVLTQITRAFRNILDQLPVKCTACGQSEIQRCNFNDHIQKVCPKIIVSCSSTDIKCPWKGERGHLNQHLAVCCFGPMKPIITQLISENQQLKGQVNQQATQLTGQLDEISQLKKQMNQQRSQIDGYQNENQQLKKQVNQQTTQITGQLDEISQLKKQMNQQRSQIYGYQNEYQRLTDQLNQLNSQSGGYQNENQQFEDQVIGVKLPRYNQSSRRDKKSYFSKSQSIKKSKERKYHYRAEKYEHRHH